jgi:hypothetical protein
LAGLLAVGPTRSAHAQRIATESAEDQSIQPPPPTRIQGPEQRIALVIGNSNYQNVAQLSNPSNDAKAISQLLRLFQRSISIITR